MTSTNDARESVTAPFEADLARAEDLHARLETRVAELSSDPENAEAQQLRELKPKLAARIADLRNSVEVVKLVEDQLALEEYVRIDGDAPLITRILGYVAMADERTRRETMAAFTARGEKVATIEDAVMRLYERGLVKRTRRGVVKAVHAKAWKAIEETKARQVSGLTQRVLEMIETEGPCGRRRILARFTGEGIARGAVDSSLQRLRVRGKVSTVRTSRTVSYTVSQRVGEPDAPPQDAAAGQAGQAEAT